MLQNEQETTVRKMLATLPPDYRLPVVLRYWHESSYEEIAEATHSTVSAVKSRLFRARAMLANRVGQLQAAPHG
jgi:RNA polymerase sigma-70 factor (ECF subfamily)